MQTRSTATRALAVLCLAGLLGLGSTAVLAGSGVTGSPGSSVEPADSNTFSLRVQDPNAPNQIGLSSNNVAVGPCPQFVLPNDGGTSGNERAPNLRNRFGRSVYLVKQTELAAAGVANGAAITGIGWTYTTAPGLTGSTNLVIYMQNTSDLTNLKSTTWATAVAPMTIVHNGAITLPNLTGGWYFNFTGGSPFTYTGGGVYVAFDAPYPVGTLSTTTVVSCNSLGLPVNGLLGAQSNTSNPTTLAASAFRPETIMVVPTPDNDAAAIGIQAYGSVPRDLVGDQTVTAVLANRGALSQTSIPATLAVSGANSFSDSQNTGTVAQCGNVTTLAFNPYTPAVVGSDTTMVSVPSDDVNTNNVITVPTEVTISKYSYKYPGTLDSGGVGLTGLSGAFVGKFSVTQETAVTDVLMSFFAATATTYKVAIYADSGGGMPGAQLYLDAANRTVTVAGPVTITLPSPVLVGPGDFYVGIQQTNTTNANISFNTESPIRTSSFFFTTALPPVTWINFSPGNNFKLNIGILLDPCAGTAACNDSNSCTLDSCSGITGCSHTPISPPSQINASVAVAKTGTGSTVSWADAPGAFNVYRGSATGSWFYDHSCYASWLEQSSIPDSTNPPVGEAWYYLIARRNVCTESGLGVDSFTNPRPNTNPCADPEPTFMDDVDAGYDPLNPGCHWRFNQPGCTGFQSFDHGDQCLNATTIREWGNNTCHNPYAGDFSDLDCNAVCSPNSGACVVVQNFCGPGGHSAQCVCN